MHIKTIAQVTAEPCASDQVVTRTQEEGEKSVEARDVRGILEMTKL